MSKELAHEPFYMVDNVWWCGCGSLNAATREECGGCGKVKPK